MKSFKWGVNYLTGILLVDEQHKELVNLINTMSHHLSKGAVDFQLVDNTFNSLASYALYHFTEEQEMMEQVGVDKRHLDNHIAIHQSFLQEVEALHAESSLENPTSVEYLLDFLIHWLAYHILVTDKNMARQVELIKSGSTAEQAFAQEEQEASISTEPLITALNGLFHQVSMRNKELAELNKTLEKQVEERTKALSEANILLKELSLTDVLTGLPNRRYAMQQLDLIWNESINNHSPVACMMIDADYFKQINDTYGHDAGDTVLCTLSKTLLHSVRTDDIVCRLGGDEFIIICPNTNSDGAMQAAKLVQQAVSALKVQAGNGVWNGSVSIGVAVNDSEMIDYGELIKVADNGVYLAKEDGRGCVRAAAI